MEVKTTIRKAAAKTILSQPGLSRAVNRVVFDEEYLGTLLADDLFRYRLLSSQRLFALFTRVLLEDRFLKRVLSDKVIFPRLLSQNEFLERVAKNSGFVEWFFTHPGVLEALSASDSATQRLLDESWLRRKVVSNKSYLDA